MTASGSAEVPLSASHDAENASVERLERMGRVLAVPPISALGHAVEVLLHG